MSRLQRIKAKYRESKNWFRGPQIIDTRWLIERLEQCEKALEEVPKEHASNCDSRYEWKIKPCDCYVSKISAALKSLKEEG